MTSYIVSLYLEDLAYGGPEEGGWYYSVGQLVRVIRTFADEGKAYDYCRKLNRRLESRVIGPNVGRYAMSSVLSDGEYSALVHEDKAPEYFPERRPYYE
jgi:hypothetical protein